MQQTQLIVFVILIQISGTFGALLFGSISDKKSSKEAIVISLLILIASITCLLFSKGIISFYIIGFIPVY